MDPLVQQKHEECMRLIRQLDSAIEQDQEEMRQCVRGELVGEYCRSMDQAREMLCRIKKTLIILQSENI